VPRDVPFGPRADIFSGATKATYSFEPQTSRGRGTCPRFASTTSICITRFTVRARRSSILGGLPVTRGPGCVKSNIFLNTSKFSASTIAALDVLIVRTGSTKLFADDTVGLMDAVGIERAHIYGISMGGGIVQEIAINHPHRTLSLVINCSFAKMDRYGARVTENIMNVYKAQGPHEAARHMTLFCYTLPYFNTHKDEIDAKERSIGDAQRPAHAFIRSTEACIGHDARSRLNQIKVPTLVNCGSEDTWCSVGCSQ